MQTITFTNGENGLSCTFSTADRDMQLADFDGCSCGSDAVTFRPLEMDGQRFASSNLTARTITFTANFCGRSDGRYSRSAARTVWETIQKVFVPGKVGTLLWTDGTVSRTIECRTSETPACKLLAAPALFTFSLSLIADSPLWYDTVVNSVPYEAGGHTNIVIENTSGIAVPFTVEVSANVDVFTMYSTENAAWLSFGGNVGSGFTIDTENCTVITGSGEYKNNLLTADSEFFYLVPGTNHITWAGAVGTVLKWRKAFMGVG